MKYIELTQGKRAKVDNDLYQHLNQWKWYYRKRSGSRKGGDVVRTLHGKDKNGVNFSQTLYMTSLICPAPKGYMIDHISQDTLDNQRSNLRAVPPRINLMNAGARVNNKLKEKNIHWAHDRQRYVVQARHGSGKRTWKAFRTLKEARHFRDTQL